MVHTPPLTQVGARAPAERRVWMRAVQYRPSIPRFVLARLLGKRFPVTALPLRLERVPAPEPPAGWVRVRVRLAGVCGSDLALLYGKNSPRLSPFFSFPAVLGHEILGEVAGSRVVVNPLLACRERGLEPCPACREGEEGRCVNVARGALAPGMLGFHRELPGGWSEMVVAHPARLYPVPDRVPDERAVFAEPFAVVVRGVRLAFEGGFPRRVLMVGAGTIGLLAVRALRLLGFTGEVHVIARRPHQAEFARRMGADRVHAGLAEAAQAGGSERYRAVFGYTAWRGGFDAVVDAAGSASSLEQASWMVREGGTILLLGAPGVMVHDFAPYWFREVRLVGSYVYAARDFRDAVEMLVEAEGLEVLLTHTFPLHAWPEALRTAVRHRGVKVAFAPGGARRRVML
ncbi:L-iditol 2-dehydrogenase [Marinithermus hydrothermalis DSM 14884]|uniref:L-iditol 2-dehydrogenase n=2 Tax=Marinithermus TaxID=186191 RepID=F2NQ45_MARHT|nr:L-iditol 2-dehydrogenase [Marinithermus hydrothermalis DSM 14884]